jgi:hypothetical protein
MTMAIPALWVVGQSHPLRGKSKNLVRLSSVTGGGLRRCDVLELPMGWLFEKLGNPQPALRKEIRN